MYRTGIDKDSPDKYSLSLTRFPGSVFTEYRYEGSIFIKIASWGIYFFKHILSVIIHVFMWLSARRASQFSGNHLYNHQCSWFPDYVILCVCIVLHDLLSVEHKGATSITLQHIFLLTNCQFCTTHLRPNRYYDFTTHAPRCRFLKKIAKIILTKGT